MENQELIKEAVEAYQRCILAAQEEEDMDKVADAWKAGMIICDSIMDNPMNNGTKDRIKDIRNKCCKLYHLHK